MPPNLRSGRRGGEFEVAEGIIQELMEVSKRYSELDDWELSEQTHEFREWADHFRGEISPIPWQDFLRAQGKPEMIVVVERDEAARQTFDEVFGPDS